MKTNIQKTVRMLFSRLFSLSAYILLSALSFSLLSVSGQSPNSMSYQAVIRNSNDVLVTNTQIGMRISILQGSTSGTAVYTETLTPTTNANGLISIEIGSGAGFSTIDWANDIYFIKTETDPNGGTNYTITGTSQLLSVPYALYAKNSGNSTPGPQGIQGETGDTGPEGPQGPIGLTGEDGIDGEQGIQGEQGPEGAAGPQGEQGPIGAQGAEGPEGPQGESGTAGQNGIGGITQVANLSILSLTGAGTNDDPYLINATEADPIYTSWNKSTGISITKNQIADFPNLANIATSGSYDDLTNKPTIPIIPTNVSDFINDAGYLTVEIDGSVTNEIELPTDVIAGELAYYDGAIWVKIPKGNEGQILSMQAGIPVWQNQFSLPSVILTPVSEITATSAKLNGTVNANGLSTVVTFEYGTSNTYGNTILASQNPITGSNITEVSANISGLTGGTVYYVRIKTENAIGISYSNELNFKYLVVGDVYQGGIIAYLLQPSDAGYDLLNQHGIIAASSDQTTGLQWSNGSYFWTNANNWGIGGGIINTDIIINAQGPGNYAAQLCKDLELNGYDDWYLPSKTELDKLYDNRVLIGGFANNYYWSSTEDNYDGARRRHFGNGASNGDYKSMAWLVRAVRNF